MGTMTDSETYNGYANRETWAFNLHWQNDQGLYNEALEYARQIIKQTEGANLSDGVLGEYVVEWLKELLADGSFDSDTERMIRSEVGSFWRIDYTEVGAAVRESLDAES